MKKSIIALGFLALLLSLVWGSLTPTLQQDAEAGPNANPHPHPHTHPHSQASSSSSHDPHNCPYCSKGH